jgi:catechol 2,3-dioxygenase-like lactoylglutathione lyase family enzyme
MIFGAHIVLYSKNADADRAFFRDILGLKPVDAGHGWLIFALPPTELACHPAPENGGQEIYLMCDDLAATIQSLNDHNVECDPPEDARWGRLTHLSLPGGGKLGLYQPKHPIAARRRTL